MIINTGMRTDIPAYYSDWFYRRLQEGYVMVRNPYHYQQVTRYELSPGLVDAICFCSKNPAPMLGRLDELEPYRQFWMVTITPYEKDIEPFVPDKQQAMDTFRRLSMSIGRVRISWRYDPILITDKYSVDFHIKNFEDMASYLSGYTDRCVISFLDIYEKTRRNFPLARQVKDKEREQLGQAFAESGKRHGIVIHSCCEGTGLKRFGIDTDGCMTQQILEKAMGCNLEVPAREHNLRQECGCILGHDIGMYNTCPHGCLYCYANADQDIVRKNKRLHDPHSAFLIGHAEVDDEIHIAEQHSFIDQQLRLELS